MNVAKQHVPFVAVQTVFDDVNAEAFYDEARSGAEERFIIIGEAEIDRVLTVCRCYRAADAIRPVSARGAAKAGSRDYFRR